MVESLNTHIPLVDLLSEIRQCRACEDYLEPNPVLRASISARLLIVGQAPGTRVHATGIPWNDPSGDRLRRWMNVDKKTFYDESTIAIVPMGFCYPGKGKSGDLPPRPECAALWHQALRQQLPNIGLTLLVGSYAQAYYLGANRGRTLADTVGDYQKHLSKGFFPLPHPSPRNTLWLKKHAWFEQDIVPLLQERLADLIDV